MEQNKYAYYLKELQDVQLVMNDRVFIYLDMVLLSFFLFFILYALTAQMFIPFIISISLLAVSVTAFTLLSSESELFTNHD